MNLYEIKENYLELMRKIETGEIEAEFIADTLESIQDELDTKIDNISCYIKNLQAEAQAIKDEETRLYERRKAKESKADSLTAYLEKIMIEANVRKVETSRNSIVIKTTPPSVKVDDGFIAWATENGWDDLIRVKTTYEPNKVELKERMKSGDVIPHCRLEHSEKITIK